MGNGGRNNQRPHFVVQQIFIIATLSYLASLLCGCVAQRGIDFGHWVMSAEEVELLRVVYRVDARKLDSDTRVLLLYPYGDVPENNMKDIHKNIYQGVRTYLPGLVFSSDKSQMFLEYANRDNIMMVGDRFDPQEIARLGTVADATHVVCVDVREYRPYVPQVLALNFVVVDVDTKEIIAELNATLDASEQKVVVAVGDYLQKRRARKYDDQNLDIVLRSPSEYAAFAASECCGALGQALWRKKPAMKSYVLVEEMEVPE